MADKIREERRCVGDIPDRLLALDESVDKLRQWMESMTNDINTNYADFREWRAEHERAHNEIKQSIDNISEPIEDIRRGFDGLSVISKALIVTAKTVAAISIIVSAFWAAAHFGGK